MAGLCDGGEDDAPSATPSWSRCRDGAPAGAGVPLPFAAFDSALPGGAASRAPVTATPPRGGPMGTDAFSRPLGGKRGATAFGLTAGIEACRRDRETTTSMAGSGYRPQASLPGAATDVAGLFAGGTFVLGRGLALDEGARRERPSCGVGEAKASTDLAWACLGTRATSALPCARGACS